MVMEGKGAEEVLMVEGTHPPQTHQTSVQRTHSGNWIVCVECLAQWACGQRILDNRRYSTLRVKCFILCLRVCVSVCERERER